MAEVCQRCRDGHHFLWDGRVLDTVDDELFEPGAWARKNALVGQARGRGAACFLQADGDEQWVLRHSRRGGVAAHVSDDVYVWLGARHCRVFREWWLLADMRKRGLPVPTPVAARVVRQDMRYRGDLITVRVPTARPLSDWLVEQAPGRTAWRAIGATIARFHRAGVDHHDLNARNILLGETGAITLIDFDKSRLRRRPGLWRERNMARLRRSLDKLVGQQPGLNFVDADWLALQHGYASGDVVS